MYSLGAVLIISGKLFQSLGAATVKALSPYSLKQDIGTVNIKWPKRSHWSECSDNSSKRYDGAIKLYRKINQETKKLNPCRV